MSGSGDFSIGSAVWPGISKLTEECGELIQVAGKLVATGGEVTHWDGTNLKVRLEQEIADVWAAIQFVTFFCGLDDAAIDKRAEEKLALFTRWHHEQRQRAAAPDLHPDDVAARLEHDPGCPGRGGEHDQCSC